MLKLSTTLINSILMLFMISLVSCISCHNENESKETNYNLYKVNIKSSLNVRLEPTSSSKKIGTLYNNDKVNVIEINNDWAKIKYGSQYAYVSSRYLTLVKDNTKSNLNFDNNDANDVKDFSNNKVVIFDNANLISNEEYTIINQAYANINAYIVIWTTETIDKGDIICYNDDIADKLEEEPYESKVKANKPSDIDEDDIYIITYIKDLGLMQINNESPVMDLINITMPQKILFTQSRAKEYGLTAGVIDLSLLINEAKIKYENNNWFIRLFIKGASLGEMISDFIFKDSIVPSNNFLYKYFFSWVTKIPRDLVNFLIALFGSLNYVMIILCILYAMFVIIRANILGGGYNRNNKKQLTYLLPLSVILSFIFVCLIVIMFYTMCDIADITAMKMYGWNNVFITNLLEQNLNYNISRSWWMSLLFFIGMFVYKLPNPTILVAGFLPCKIQQQLAKINPSHFEQNLELASKELPYTELSSDKLGETIGTSIFTIIILTLLLNGTSMMYATIFVCSISVAKIYSIVKLYSSWKSYGYFKQY